MTVAQGRDRSSAARRSDPGRSRVVALVRLAVALWLVINAVTSLASSPSSLDPSGAQLAVLLRLAALQFTLGIFLLSGFMSRIGGVVLAALALWEAQTMGWQPMDVVMILVGVYLALRGGGTWAMDVYVEKMQDRVRQREAREAEERQRASLAE